MGRSFLLLAALLVCCCWGQYQQFSEAQIHRVLKAKGFYEGDVNAAWSSASTEAMRKLGAEHDYVVSDGLHDAKHHHFQRIFADWFLDNDPESVKPSRVGVFFVTFNRDQCGSAATNVRCRADDVDEVLKQLWKDPQRNVQRDLALGTRGVVRLDFSDDWVHHVSLGDLRTQRDLTPFVKSELGWDPAERYTFRIYLLPSDYRGLRAFAGAEGTAYGRDSFYVMRSQHTFCHELGHNLGLNHCGAMRFGGFEEYGGYTSAMSHDGYSFHALDLLWLRVIHRNVLELTESQPRVSIKSLTSLSEGYQVGQPYSHYAGKVAATYQSPNDGPFYTIEWRELKRQDWWLRREYEGALLIHHKRDDHWRTIVDAVVPVGKSWTSPRGDLVIRHTGPQPGTFAVTIRPPTHPNAAVKFFSWTAYWNRLKKAARDQADQRASRLQQSRQRAGLELTTAQLNDVAFLRRLVDMCSSRADPRCEEGTARLQELEAGGR